MMLKLLNQGKGLKRLCCAADKGSWSCRKMEDYASFWTKEGCGEKGGTVKRGESVWYPELGCQEVSSLGPTPASWLNGSELSCLLDKKMALVQSREGISSNQS